ncbi:hypothetical protein [Serratia fonticola]|uniref:hypothetical protein n=1 Tax=Serratia fonticola TaxID=47917 RepID=UPI0027F38EDB|nr:hypothetical protein [Serratia fonticola]MDQ7208483.1 hypothetical protein [Serratia fonticola]HBE9078604.1 hypothetical protein [Serratia fonticola]HBE9151696.1 hypothetical protein [Serratia fonticola]
MANNKGVIANNKKPLKYHNRREHPLHRLPFVGSKDDESSLSFWAVPRTGGYAGAAEAGEAMALIYLKHLRQHGMLPGGNLQWVVLEMCGMSNLGSHLTQEQNSLAGQIVGFFSVLDGWLAASAKRLGSGLDAGDPLELLAKANAGLELTKARSNHINKTTSGEIA